ncbi:MAG: hypothetical protein IT210_22230 [Armatimonadetes bacterium]|nr:hypothetical protein [Armatimonadota bacterium]
MAQKGNQVSTGTAVAVILIVIVLIATIYYTMMKPKSSEAPFAGKGLPMSKMKGENSGGMPMSGGQTGQ